MTPPPEYFDHLYEYVKWADLKQLEATKSLSDEEYFKERGWSFGSIHKLMLHMISAQNIWLNRFLKEQPVWLTDDPRMKSRAMLAPEWHKVHLRVSTFISAQTPESLRGVIDYTTRNGDSFSTAQWKLLVHVCNHAMQHRGQLNSMIKLAGGTPVTVDYSWYVTHPS